MSKNILTQNKKNLTPDTTQIFVWKILLNIWSIISLLIITLDFFNFNQYNSATSVVLVIYIAVLGIYATSKEIDRWTKRFYSRYFGELFVVIWTILVITMLSISLLNTNYQVSTEITAAYISILGIYAITKKSKNIKQNKK